MTEIEKTQGGAGGVRVTGVRKGTGRAVRTLQYRAGHREEPSSGSGPRLPGQDPQTRRLALPY